MRNDEKKLKEVKERNGRRSGGGRGGGGGLNDDEALTGIVGFLPQIYFVRFLLIESVLLSF